MRFAKEHATSLLLGSMIVSMVLIAISDSGPLLVIGLVGLPISTGVLIWRMYQRQKMLHAYVSQAEQHGQGQSPLERAKHMRAFQDMFHRH